MDAEQNTVWGLQYAVTINITANNWTGQVMDQIVFVFVILSEKKQWKTLMYIPQQR